MQRIIYLILYCYAAAVCMASCTHPVTATPAHADTIIYIMAGQSNMAGRGEVTPADTVTNPRILALDTADRFTVATEPNQIRQGSNAGLDCGLSFGNALLPQLSARTSVGLVRCAISSTSIQQWLGDSLTGGVPLYSFMLRRARRAGKSGPVKAVLWHQGETNGDDSMICRAYGVHLEAFILKFRADMGNPHLPFIIGRLAAWCNKPYKDSVNAGIEQAARELSDVYVIPTNDLTPKADQLHFDAASQRELGRRFAAMAVLHGLK